MDTIRNLMCLTNIQRLTQSSWHFVFSTKYEYQLWRLSYSYFLRMYLSSVTGTCSLWFSLLHFLKFFFKYSCIWFIFIMISMLIANFNFLLYKLFSLLLIFPFRCHILFSIWFLYMSNICRIKYIMSDYNDLFSLNII